MCVPEHDRRQTGLQRIARQTRGVVTPANLLDGAAFLGALWAGPRLENWPGLVAGIASYSSDVVDGKIARATGTASSLGDMIDHVGDKPKIAYALYHIWRMRLADRPLLVTVATYNAVTASITVYDRLANGTSRIEVTTQGKRAMFATATGVGVQTVATKISRTRPKLGRALNVGGAVLAYLGVTVFGPATIRQYWRSANG
jgi:phosphatidylglycerophosphate synthase